MAFIPVYILILFLTIVIDYIAGIAIEGSSGNKRKWFLTLSIVANVGVLAFFKYYNFFATNVNDLLHLSNWNSDVHLLNIILPIGLSFHTFQAMSYTIEVYRGNQKAERHIGIYALYVMFYPQLVAGPIERPQHVLPQIHEKHTFDYDNAVRGLRLILWGMVKKVVIADRLATYTDMVFDHPARYSGIALLTGAVFFAFQIFCDFSGYSDIALGTARVMGFKLMTNFNKPYHARSISEFWKRWHISLSTWFKDYLYIPMGGNRVSVPRAYFNLLFVFIISGFWHGANWTFIAWGALHGFYSIFAVITKAGRKKLDDKTGISKIHWLNNTLNVFITFTLVDIAWVFFRANNVSDAFLIFRKFIHIPREIKQMFITNNFAFLNFPLSTYSILFSFSLIVFLEVAHIIHTKFNWEDTFNQKPAYLRWSLYYLGIAAILVFGVFEKRQFIYFQF